MIVGEVVVNEGNQYRRVNHYLRPFRKISYDNRRFIRVYNDENPVVLTLVDHIETCYLEIDRLNQLVTKLNSFLIT